MRWMEWWAILLMGGGFLAGPLRAEIAVAPNGEIEIPAANCDAEEGRLVARFKMQRWGMYSLEVHGDGKQRSAEINGAGPRRQGSGGAVIGDYYIANSGPCEVAVLGPSQGITSLKLVPTWEGGPIVQEPGRPIELDAKDCRIEGVMLRYEPSPKKLCIGFWGNPNDTPHWRFTVATAGRYEVILTQGCGKGGGGSAAVLETAGASLDFTVQDTGGYQNWVERPLGTVTFEEPGEQELQVRVVKKARGIMDIRRIVLKPVQE